MCVYCNYPVEVLTGCQKFALLLVVLFLNLSEFSLKLLLVVGQGLDLPLQYLHSVGGYYTPHVWHHRLRKNL